MTEKQTFMGAVELGGTKVVCGIGNGPNDIIERRNIQTTTPSETLREVSQYFSARRVDRLAIASFGPIDINKSSKTYGRILKTPKEGWVNTDVLGILRKGLNIPTDREIPFDSDVNMALVGEHFSGATKGFKNCIYITVGTGIGAGAIINGSMVAGPFNTEMGHMAIPKYNRNDPDGCCKYHQSCWEGFASGTALQESLFKGPHKEHREVYYLARGVLNLIQILAPEVIIMGGGVMKTEGLIEKVREAVWRLNSGYIESSCLDPKNTKYIVKPKHDGASALIGCFAKLEELEK